MDETNIVKTVTRKIFPVLVLFGFYLVSYGHLSPGGGFQGGVVLGSALILLCLSQGIVETEKRFRYTTLNMIKSTGALIFLGIGFLGIVLGLNFLTDFLPTGEIGSIPSAGSILLLNLAIGMKVGTGTFLIIHTLMKFIPGDKNGNQY